MGGMIVCDTVVWLWCLLPVSSPAMMELPGRFMTTEFLLEDLSSGRQGEFKESLSLHLLFFK